MIDLFNSPLPCKPSLDKTNKQRNTATSTHTLTPLCISQGQAHCAHVPPFQARTAPAIVSQLPLSRISHPPALTTRAAYRGRFTHFLASSLRQTPSSALTPRNFAFHARFILPVCTRNLVSIRIRFALSPLFEVLFGCSQHSNKQIFR